ncbi:transcriptional regulator, MarR family [Sulfolobus islandicus Y.G.57.14]|uniref:Transcriptional regulator, MarR family n=1 Tax=Saccharolobus islandicus (strain Y.G.57.14 / Yellowstone \|nr:MarR family winged helix-turn-helix transcriptional regulator [Sulfolobus islandicus]ACP45878.1 transcriptional regulator, MarR family [Sulfolobus islandicus Y.G.57.14]
MKRRELTEIQQRVLLFLLDNEGDAFRDISDKTESNPNAIKKAIDELMELGLVYDKREESFPRRRLVFLTDYGKEVARRLKEIVEIIEESAKHPRKPSVEV